MQTSIVRSDYSFHVVTWKAFSVWPNVGIQSTPNLWEGITRHFPECRPWLENCAKENIYPKCDQIGHNFATWAKFQNIWQLFEGLFSALKNLNLLWHINYTFWANLKYWKKPSNEKLFNHLVTLIWSKMGNADDDDDDDGGRLKSNKKERKMFKSMTCQLATVVSQSSANDVWRKVQINDVAKTK